MKFNWSKNSISVFFFLFTFDFLCDLIDVRSLVQCFNRCPIQFCPIVKVTIIFFYLFLVVQCCGERTIQFCPIVKVTTLWTCGGHLASSIKAEWVEPCAVCISGQNLLDMARWMAGNDQMCFLCFVYFCVFFKTYLKKLKEIMYFACLCVFLLQTCKCKKI